MKSIFDKALKKKLITKKMAQKLKLYHEHFYSLTDGGHSICSYNSFVGVGFLKEEERISGKHENDFVVYQTGSSDQFRSIWRSHVYLTLDELEDLKSCIEEAIEQKQNFSLS